MKKLIPLVVALELGVLEPQVLALRRAFEAGEALNMLPERLWITSALFALVMVVVLFAVGKSTSALRFPEAWRRQIVRAFSEIRQLAASTPVATGNECCPANSLML